jgi:recombination protein RecT
MSIQGEVEQRQGSRLTPVEQQMRQAHQWFAQLVPSHVDVKQFLAVAGAALKKTKGALDAANNHPQSFLMAAAECARLGLVPGVTYHFAPFHSKDAGCQVITGIVDYKGEIELIYRSGRVSAVKFEIVRMHDEFLWRPTQMKLPRHEIKGDGLATEDIRGAIRGAYAYAEMLDGSISQVVVFSKSQIDKRRAVAKTQTFWNAWEEEMTLKTVLHRLYDVVPHSPEHMAELFRAQAAAASRPLDDTAQVIEPLAAEPAELQHAQGALPAGQTVTGRAKQQQRGKGQQRQRPGRTGDKPADADDGQDEIRDAKMRQIHALLSEAGLGGSSDGKMRHMIAGVLVD